MIEEIEELKPQLQVPSLGYVSIFVSSEVSFDETGLTELLSLLVAICSQRRCRKLTSREHAILAGRGSEYSCQVSATRHGLVIAADVRIVEVVAIGVVVTTRSEGRCGHNRERISGLINRGTTKAPASRQKSGSPSPAI